MQKATKMMGLSIICFKGSQVDFPNKQVRQSLNITFIIANSAGPGEMQHCHWDQKLPIQSVTYLGIYRKSIKYSCPSPLDLVP